MIDHYTNDLQSAADYEAWRCDGQIGTAQDYTRYSPPPEVLCRGCNRPIYDGLYRQRGAHPGCEERA